MTPLSAKDFVDIVNNSKTLDSKISKILFSEIDSDKTARISIKNLMMHAMMEIVFGNPATVLQSIFYLGIMIGRELEQKQKEVEDLNKLYSK